MSIGKTITVSFTRCRLGSPLCSQTLPRSLRRGRRSHSTAAATSQPSNFSVYIHWPYCESKCTYCNFNKYINPSDPPVERLTKALLKELQFYLNAPQFGLKERKIASIYFGGGTPSLASPSTVERILTALNVSSEIEVTLEANPTSSEVARLRDFKQAGVNRLSLGVQSFNDADLKLMGRDHTGKEAVSTIEEAKRLFDNFTFDLIFARPGQTVSDWKHELKHTLNYLAGNHLSIYQLTMERGTPLWKSRKLIPPLPSPDEAADMYDLTVQMAESYGFAHYEVSNYARTRSAISRHNFSYWQGMDYLGIGPGAHGRLTNLNTLERIRTFGEFHPEKYMALCEQEGEGIRKWKSIPPQEILEELIVFGLRTRMGIPKSRFRKVTGRNLMDVLDKEAVETYIDLGFLELDSNWPDSDRYIPQHLQHELQEETGGLRPTEAGLARMDSILPNITK